MAYIPVHTLRMYIHTSKSVLSSRFLSGLGTLGKVGTVVLALV